MITERQVQAFEIDMVCDSCGGVMRPTGMVLLAIPPKYPHRCTGCGIEGTFDVAYPRFEYRRIMEVVE